MKFPVDYYSEHMKKNDDSIKKMAAVVVQNVTHESENEYDKEE
jgi:hypothetical protein